MIHFPVGVKCICKIVGYSGDVTEEALDDSRPSLDGIERCIVIVSNCSPFFLV